MLRPIHKEILFSKNDPRDLRLGDLVELVDTNEIDWGQQLNSLCLVGYPDDEGIQLNHGRLGAKDGPDAIRTLLYKLTAPAEKDFRISDIGNLKTDTDLANRHEQAQRIICNLTKHKKKWLSLGGGHDYGYPDAAGFVEAHIKNKPVVINFDAHLDVRPTEKGLNSGTSFFRLLEQFGSKFEFIEVGIQEHCNSRYHEKYVLSKGGKIIGAEKISSKGLWPSLFPLLTKFKKNPIFVSLDIDVFSSHEAPGCSQSWPLGLSSKEFFPGFKKLVQQFNIDGLGIYEVSPPLDLNLNTQRLAGLASYIYLTENFRKKKSKA